MVWVGDRECMYGKTNTGEGVLAQWVRDCLSTRPRAKGTRREVREKGSMLNGTGSRDRAKEGQIFDFGNVFFFFLWGGVEGKE